MGICLQPEIAPRLTRAREEAGLTQAQFARVMLVPLQTVVKWELGAGSPQIGQIRRVCSELGVTSDYLLFGIERHPQCPPEGRSECAYAVMGRARCSGAGRAG